MLGITQKLLLSEKALAYKSYLFGSLGEGVTSKLRNQIWDYITSELIVNGAPADLTAHYLRHTEWGNLTRSVMEKYKKHLKSGAEGNLADRPTQKSHLEL